MTYKLRMFRIIKDMREQGGIQILQKDFILPFVPWIGLTIYDHNPLFNFGELPLIRLCWSSTLESFVGRTEVEKWGNKSNSREIADEVSDGISDQVTNLMRDGWTDQLDDL